MVIRSKLRFAWLENIIISSNSFQKWSFSFPSLVHNLAFVHLRKMGNAFSSLPPSVPPKIPSLRVRRLCTMCSMLPYINTRLITRTKMYAYGYVQFSPPKNMCASCHEFAHNIFFKPLLLLHLLLQKKKTWNL